MFNLTICTITIKKKKDFLYNYTEAGYNSLKYTDNEHFKGRYLCQNPQVSNIQLKIPEIHRSNSGLFK